LSCANNHAAGSLTQLVLKPVFVVKSAENRHRDFEQVTIPELAIDVRRAVDLGSKVLTFHSITVPPSPAARYRPSGLNATAVTPPFGCSSNGLAGLREVTSHKTAPRPPPVASSFPSGLGATDSI